MDTSPFANLSDPVLKEATDFLMSQASQLVQAGTRATLSKLSARLSHRKSETGQGLLTEPLSRQNIIAVKSANVGQVERDRIVTALSILRDIETGDFQQAQDERWANALIIIRSELERYLGRSLHLVGEIPTSGAQLRSTVEAEQIEGTIQQVSIGNVSSLPIIATDAKLGIVRKGAEFTAINIDQI